MSKFASLPSSKNAVAYFAKESHGPGFLTDFEEFRARVDDKPLFALSGARLEKGRPDAPALHGVAEPTIRRLPS